MQPKKSHNEQSSKPENTSDSELKPKPTPTTGKRGETYIDKNGIERYVANGQDVIKSRVRSKKYGNTHIEYKRKQEAIYCRNGKSCIIKARKRAKKKGLPHNITHAYMMSLWPASGKDWTGHPMVWKGERDGKSGLRPSSPTIDMIDPSLGYVEGNVEWLANRTNHRKGAWTPDEMRAFLKHIEEMKNANDAQTRTSLQTQDGPGESTIEGKRLLKNIQSVLQSGRRD